MTESPASRTGTTGSERETAAMRGYEALRETAGVVEGSGRRLVRVWGERARDMIGGLVTNHVAGLGPGRALYTFMLTPKGRPVSEMRVLVLAPSELWLDLPAACAGPTLEHLKRYLPPLYARFEPREDVTRLSVIGPRSARVIASLPAAPPLGELAPLEVRALEADGAAAFAPLLVRREPVEGPGADLYLPAAGAAALRSELLRATAAAGGGEVGPAAYEAWRVERGIPVYGAEIDLEIFPQETGQEGRAISFDKGCYTGQEVVARIHFRGHVNHRLAGFRFEGTVPEPGTELFGEDRPRGRVTSAVVSPRLGPIGLGYVRRETAPGTRLAVGSAGGPAADVVELPFEGAAAAG